MVTETWLKEGAELEGLREGLEEEAGLGMVCRNRIPGERGVSHGGVAILWQTSKMTVKVLDIKNSEDYEVLATAATVPGQRRKLVILACYIPPNYVKKRGEGALDYITDRIVELKRRFHDPQLLIAGDFNQWDIALSLIHI